MGCVNRKRAHAAIAAANRHPVRSRAFRGTLGPASRRLAALTPWRWAGGDLRIPSAQMPAFLRDRHFHPAEEIDRHQRRDIGDAVARSGDEFALRKRSSICSKKCATRTRPRSASAGICRSRPGRAAPGPSARASNCETPPFPQKSRCARLRAARRRSALSLRRSRPSAAAADGWPRNRRRCRWRR